MSKCALSESCPNGYHKTVITVRTSVASVQTSRLLVATGQATPCLALGWTMIVDTLFLAMLGFPEWALIANVLVRHFYGEFIHADLPWTYGPVGRLIVSPVMHRQTPRTAKAKARQQATSQPV